MKRNHVLWMLIVAVCATACQKSELPPKANEPAEVMEIASQRNGGGPYVLNILIQLRGENEVPAVNTTAIGVAHLRLTADRMLYSKIIINNVEEGDALRFAHVHAAGLGINGPVRIFLARTPDDFGKNMVQELSEENYQFLLNDPAYVNAHSNFYPTGIVRGQIR